MWRFLFGYMNTGIFSWLSSKRFVSGDLSRRPKTKKVHVWVKSFSTFGNNRHFTKPNSLLRVAQCTKSSLRSQTCLFNKDTWRCKVFKCIVKCVANGRFSSITRDCTIMQRNYPVFSAPLEASIDSRHRQCGHFPRISISTNSCCCLFSSLTHIKTKVGMLSSVSPRFGLTINFWRLANQILTDWIFWSWLSLFQNDAFALVSCFQRKLLPLNQWCSGAWKIFV